MNEASRQNHWENVYATKGESEVSWFQETPAPSLELIALVGAVPGSAIVDAPLAPAYPVKPALHMIRIIFRPAARSA
jgi:hypothetical protein